MWLLQKTFEDKYNNDRYIAELETITFILENALVLHIAYVT